VSLELHIVILPGGSQMLKKLTPNLMVENVQQTLSFYHDVLDFKVLMTLPDQPPFDFAVMQHDQVELMFQSRDSLSENVPALTGSLIGASQTFYIEVEGLKKLYENLRDRVEIVVDLHTTFYGTQEFYFRDLNGYILSFTESAPTE
jgi:lactoylglutathione lyase